MLKNNKPTVEESIDFAKYSSQIEGEYSNEAYRDHLDAWDKTRSWGNTISLNKLLDCHKELLKTLRPDIAGKLRNVDVWIGGKPCPSPYKAAAMLEEWIKKYKNVNVFNGAEDIEEAIWQAHIEYENIHPFEDGNGRTGRCIMNWQRMMHGLPIIIIHPGVEQMEYYKRFK